MIKLFVFLILGIVLVLIFMPLRFKIKLDDKKLNVDLFLFGLFNIRIDVDELFSKYLKNDENMVSVKKLIALLKASRHIKKAYKDMFKTVMIEKLSLEIFENYDNPNRVIINNLLWNYLKYFFVNNFNEVKDKTYITYYQEKNSMSIKIVLRTYLYLIIYIYLKHLKAITKSMKIIKEGYKNESSN